MNVSSEFVNWLLIGGAAILALAMGLNHLAMLAARRRARRLAPGAETPQGERFDDRAWVRAFRAVDQAARETKQTLTTEKRVELTRAVYRDIVRPSS